MTPDPHRSRRHARLRRAGEVLLRPAPVNGLRLRGLALASMLVFGGVLGLLALSTSGGRDLPATLAMISASAVLAGVALARGWDRLPAWSFHPA